MNGFPPFFFTQNSPKGFRDDGLYCAKPAAYGRGAGYPLWQKDKCNREHQDVGGCEKVTKSTFLVFFSFLSPLHASAFALLFYAFNSVSSLHCQIYADLPVKIQMCPQNGALYYPKCKQNFHNVGCCICSPDCPSGWTDIGVSCKKPESYGRGTGYSILFNKCRNNEHLIIPTVPSDSC